MCNVNLCAVCLWLTLCYMNVQDGGICVEPWTGVSGWRDSVTLVWLHLKPSFGAPLYRSSLKDMPRQCYPFPQQTKTHTHKTIFANFWFLTYFFFKYKSMCVTSLFPTLWFPYKYIGLQRGNKDLFNVGLAVIIPDRHWHKMCVRQSVSTTVAGVYCSVITKYC